MVFGQARCHSVKVIRNRYSNFVLFLIIQLEKTCESPPMVSHSEIIQPDRTTNETIQYICQDGYQLKGTAILTCLLAQWQPVAPLCERRILFQMNFKLRLNVI